ncbi:glycosyltransferase family 4 protein [Undibacterium fentianense]|uniref:Glycosyltransferase family 4 protein n=1 Tax=Undibacterium fentianense TaxID=2828728 RepID=A0A941IGL8_9BURK|nr:glycosyltransferase family 1 protein [Undibacterium fentianense]MBR7801482.1 glycosyltransferase family 4 protein [Undibacterium fentianense]
MKLILSIEAIHPPLAGIGRYAWELATRAPLHREIESIQFMSDGRWTSLPSIEEVSGSTQRLDIQTESNQVPEPIQLNYKGRIHRALVQFPGEMRRRLGRIPLVSYAYGKIMPQVVSGQLNKVKEGIFHGPNYFVPKTHLPTVLTIHDLSIYRFPNWHPKARVERMRETIPASLQRTNLVLTDSEAIRQELMQEFDFPAERIKTVLLGVDQIYYPRTVEELHPVLHRFGLSVNAYSLFVSTIEPRKNLQNLIAAYRALPAATRQRWPLVLVGGTGWESDAIHADILRAESEGWLKYLGFVEQSVLPQLYAGCRLFTYPSWYEGFGLPIAEAMASGVPVLTSNTSSMPEVANGAALLVDPADRDDIRRALQRGLEDDCWRAQAIELGLQRAAQLSWDACVNNTVAAYQSVSAMRS